MPQLPDTIDPQRRALLRTTVALTALGVPGAACAVDPSKPAAPPPTPKAFRRRPELQPLKFDPARLKGLSERLIRSHWENNYGGSVRALATVQAQIVDALADKEMPAYLYNGLKREHLLRTGSVVLHEHYFDNLGGSGRAGTWERKAIAGDFGSFDTWETEYRRIGAGLSGGSGWVVLGFNTRMQQLENFWLADHGHGPASVLPILVLDMYEHSYQMDYGAEAARYIDAFFQNIQWEAVASRLDAAHRMATSV
jgi:superoxide dismutase, Fe-Mn family